MCFTLDTNEKIIELLSSVTIKELIQLRNTIVDFDNYTVKGKITEVAKAIDKVKEADKGNRDIFDDIIKKQIEREADKVKRPWQTDPWKQPTVLYNNHVSPLSENELAHATLNGLYIVGVDPYNPETVETHM